MVPKPHLSKVRFRDVLQFIPLGHLVGAHASDDVVLDRHGKWIRTLEHHSYSPTKNERVNSTRVDLLTVKKDLTTLPKAPHLIVHPIQRTKEGRLARTRRADKCGDRTLLKCGGDVLHDRRATKAERDVPR